MIRRCGPGVCAVESRGPVPDFDQRARLRAKKGIGSREMGHFTTSPFNAVSNLLPLRSLLSSRKQLHILTKEHRQ